MYSLGRAWSEKATSNTAATGSSSTGRVERQYGGRHSRATKWSRSDDEHGADQPGERKREAAQLCEHEPQPARYGNARTQGEEQGFVGLESAANVHPKGREEQHAGEQEQGQPGDHR